MGGELVVGPSAGVPCIETGVPMGSLLYRAPVELGSSGPPASAAAREPLAPGVIPVTRIPRHGQPRIVVGPLAPLDRSFISHGDDDGDGRGGGAVSCEYRTGKRHQ